MRRPEDVEGLISDHEGAFLQDMAFSLKRGSKVIEIGAWKGKSTLYLALGALYSRSKVFTVEDFSGVEGGLRLSRKKLINNLKGSKVKVFTKYPKQTGFSLAFIDGNHYYLSVLQDLTFILKNAKPGCWVCFHDAIGGHDGVRKVIEEIVFDSNFFAEVKYCGSIVAVRFEMNHRLPKRELYYWRCHSFYVKYIKTLIPLGVHSFLSKFKRSV